MYKTTIDNEYIKRVLVRKSIGKYMLWFIMIKDSLHIIPIKCIRKLFTRIIRFYTELKIVNLLYKYDIERIMYDFAETMHLFGIESNDLSKLRVKYNDSDFSEYGITYYIFTDLIKEHVTGINMKIWTKDKLAKLNLKLLVNMGSFNLDITWAFKDEESGKYICYNRTEDILIARDEIKSILIEYVSRQMEHLLSVS